MAKVFGDGSWKAFFLFANSRRVENTGSGPLVYAAIQHGSMPSQQFPNHVNVNVLMEGQAEEIDGTRLQSWYNDCSVVGTSAGEIFL